MARRMKWKRRKRNRRLHRRVFSQLLFKFNVHNLYILHIKLRKGKHSQNKAKNIDNFFLKRQFKISKNSFENKLLFEIC